jgi:hypothetical protein
MGFSAHECRHCGESFIPLPGKPGYIDECPECLVAQVMAAQPPPPSQLEQLLAYVATHPVTVDAATGEPVRWKTRFELRQKLRRKGFSPEVVEKLVAAYMSAFVETAA